MSFTQRAIPKSAKQNSLIARSRVGQQDVGGLDVAVQQVALVRVVQRLGDGDHDLGDLGLGHPVRVALPQQPRRVGAVDIVHRDPELALEVAAIVHTDDVRMPQRGRDVGLAVEPLAILVVRRHRRGQYLERIAPRQPRMLGQIDLTHAAGAEHPDDGVPGERRTIGQRHGRIVQTRL